jgi:hypothetical protein
MAGPTGSPITAIAGQEGRIDRPLVGRQHQKLTIDVVDIQSPEMLPEAIDVVAGGDRFPPGPIRAHPADISIEHDSLLRVPLAGGSPNAAAIVNKCFGSETCLALQAIHVPVDSPLPGKLRCRPKTGIWFATVDESYGHTNFKSIVNDCHQCR